MYRDAKEELKRLEDALLAEEALSQTEEVEAYNTDTADVEMESFTDEVMNGKRGRSGLKLLVAILAVGILAVLVYWFVRFGGVFL